MNQIQDIILGLGDKTRELKQSIKTVNDTAKLITDFKESIRDPLESSKFQIHKPTK